LSFGITGTRRVTVLENGDELAVVRGRNVLADPGKGIFLTKGRVKVINSGGDLTFLESKGKVIDLCARLA
jgi:hypothetical protein